MLHSWQVVRIFVLVFLTVVKCLVCLLLCWFSSVAGQFFVLFGTVHFLQTNSLLLARTKGRKVCVNYLHEESRQSLKHGRLSLLSQGPESPVKNAPAGPRLGFIGSNIVGYL